MYSDGIQYSSYKVGVNHTVQHPILIYSPDKSLGFWKQEVVGLQVVDTWDVVLVLLGSCRA